MKEVYGFDFKARGYLYHDAVLHHAQHKQMAFQALSRQEEVEKIV